MLLHSKSGYLGLFGDLQSFGLEAPTHVAFSSREGPRPFKAGEKLEVIDMEECWIVVWFGGALGWTQWDSPWAVFLEHKPIAMKLDQAGLHLQFRRQAGNVALMPLYGYEKIKPFSEDESGKKRDKDAPPVTSEWSEFLRRDILMRVRYWAGVTRMLPIHCTESFRVDRANDSLVLRESFAWHRVHDEWDTKPLKLAPLSPALALAMHGAGFPVELSKASLDLRYVTPSGPYFGIEGVDDYEVRLSLLDVIHETERASPPDPATNHAVKAALSRLRDTAQHLFPTANAPLLEAFAATDFPAAMRGSLWAAKALPYMTPDSGSNAVSTLRAFVRNTLTTHWNRAGRDDARSPGIHFLEPLWGYAHHTGDWDFIREQWDIIRQLRPELERGGWTSLGDGSTVEMGDEAAPYLALARMAYRVGDVETYQYACYLFAGHLTRQHAKLRGMKYIRDHLPWHRAEPLALEVYLNQLLAGIGGWRMDGPAFPKDTAQRLYERRWFRFVNEDIARFHRRHSGLAATLELESLRKRARSASLKEHTLDEPPPLALLRSLLLNESPSQLTTLAARERSFPAPFEELAECVAMLRASQPVLVERLIPAAPEGSWSLGMERELGGSHSGLVVRMNTGGENRAAKAWPRPEFPSDWATSTEDALTPGRMAPVREGAPTSLRTEVLNWNSTVWVYEF